MKVEELEFEISKLSPKPGDLLIMKTDKPIEPKSGTQLAKNFQRLLPEGVQGCIIGPGFDLMLEADPVHDYDCKCGETGNPSDHGICAICGRSADEHKG